MAWNKPVLADPWSFPDRKLRNLIGWQFSFTISNRGVAFSAKNTQAGEDGKRIDTFVWIRSSGDIPAGAVVDGRWKGSPWSGPEMVAIETAMQPAVDAMIALNELVGADD